nr:unnamed protein product [Digitaria exilis]
MNGGGGRRRYSSEQFLFDGPANAGAGRWAQQRGGGVRRGDGEIFVSVEPATPARLRGGDAPAGESPGKLQQLSPGLLDLHAFDTELIPDFQVPGMYAASQKFGYGEVLDDSDMSFAQNKQMSKSTIFPENNYLRAFPEKEKTAPVAKIKVVVRKRPLNKKEISKKEEDIIDIEQRSNSLTVHETKLKVDLTEYVERHEFVFDAVLDEDVSNDEVYRETVEPVVPAIFNRTKATCFAYGQTGSGKTYTMRPLPLKASQDILRLMHHAYRNQGFQLFVSFFEIYGGKLFDLLNDRSKLCMREDGKQKVCIVGLQEYRVSDVETIKELIEKGSATRSTGTTGANEESSRSHAILQLAIKRRVDGNDSKPPRPVGKLSFIDLAGSERGADTTDNDKQTRVKSLSKGGNGKKDAPLAAPLRESCHSPLPSFVPSFSASEVMNDITERSNFGWPKQQQFVKQQPALAFADRMPKLKEGVEFSSSNDVYVKEQRSKGGMASNIAEVPDIMYQQGRQAVRKTVLENNMRDSIAYPARRAQPDEEDEHLNDLLQEEEDLVNAHRKQLEETLDILREEMNILDEADQPGNQLDEYVARLSSILSQKAAGIVDLKSRLEQFQRRLNENNVLLYAESP